MISNGYNGINIGGTPSGISPDMNAQISQLLTGITSSVPQMGGGGTPLGNSQGISAQLSQLLGGLTAPNVQMGGGGQGGGFFGGMIGNAEQPGWGNLALGGISTLLNGFMGMQQYGLAKRSLAENRRQFDMNWDAQRTTVNTQLEDRQRARVAADPNGYESVSSYMGRNAIK